MGTDTGPLPVVDDIAPAADLASANGAPMAVDGAGPGERPESVGSVYESPQWLYFLRHARRAMRETDRHEMDADERREARWWADRQGFRDALVPWGDYEAAEYVE